MSAPLFHLTPGSLDAATVGASITVDGPEGHHAATVMRLGVGEQVLLSDTATIAVTGVVTGSAPGELTVEVTEISHAETPRPKLVLVQALDKDRRDLQAVESATELGVDAVQPWTAQRSVAKWKPGREHKKHAEWQSLVTSAAKQTRRVTVPKIRELQTTAQYIAGLNESTAVIVLHETQARSFAAAVGTAAGAEELHLVVGPEGGISPEELEMFQAAGAQIAQLGASVLRSSTAGPAALAAAQLLLGRWEWDAA